MTAPAPRPTVLLELFVAFQRSAQAVELAFAEHDLDVPDFAILSTIGIEGPVTATALARRLGMAQRTMLFRVRRLVDAGLVERTRSEDDRREVHLRLTRAGAELRVTAAPAFSSLVARLEGRLRDPEAVRAAVRELADGLEAEIDAQKGRTA